MEPGKKKSAVKYNIQKLNDVAVGVKKIAHELQNIDINQTSDSTEIEMVWNRTKEAMINSETEMLGIKPKENNKNWFNDICKNAVNIRKYKEHRKLSGTFRYRPATDESFYSN